LPGNKAGKGNPHFRALAERRQAVLDAVTPADLGRVVKTLLGMAEDGDMVAAELVLRYAVGTARPALNGDEADLDELRLARANPTPEDIRVDQARVKAAFAVGVLTGHQIDNERTLDFMWIAKLRRILETSEGLGMFEGEVYLDELDSLERKYKGSRRRSKNAK
jgi:hypothetical protein